MSERPTYNPHVFPVDVSKLHGSKNVWGPEAARLSTLVAPEIVRMHTMGAFEVAERHVATIPGFPGISVINDLRSAEAQGANEIIYYIPNMIVEAIEQSGVAMRRVFSADEAITAAIEGSLALRTFLAPSGQYAFVPMRNVFSSAGSELQFFVTIPQTHTIRTYFKTLATMSDGV